MKTFIINQDEVKALKNLQVAFKVYKHGFLEVLQVEIYDEFTDAYEMADFDKYSKSGLEKIETLCMNWYNNIYSQTA